MDRKFGAIGEKILSRGMLQFGERAHKKRTINENYISFGLHFNKICGKSFSEI